MVHGVEINECRHRNAIALRDTVVRESPTAASTFDVLLGDVRTLGFADATHIILASQCWSEELLANVFTQALAARRLRCVVLISRQLPRAWSSRLSGLADSFGHAVAINYLSTTYSGASAVFFRRGDCRTGRGEKHDWSLRRGARTTRTSRCYSMDEVGNMTKLQGMWLFGGRVW
eukprot:2221485-Prymnesium_polylepis.1